MRRFAKWAALAVTLGIMALIFALSAQPGVQSYDLSAAALRAVESSKIGAVTPQWFSTTNLNANLRKWAHVYLYGVLGVSVAVTVHLWRPALRWRQKALAAAVLCTVYAAGDEVHQYFVPARAMLASDVAIDAMGFLPGALLALLLLYLWRRRRSK